MSEHTRAGLKKRGMERLNNGIESKSGRSDSEEQEDSKEPEREHRHHSPPKEVPKEQPAPQKEMSLKDLIAATGMFGLFKMFGDNQSASGMAPNFASNAAMGPEPPSVLPSIRPSIAMSDPSMNPPPVPQFSMQPPTLPMNPPPPYLVNNSQKLPERDPFSLPVEEQHLSIPKPSELSQSPAGPFSTYVLNTLSHFYNVYQSLVKIPKNATNTVYVEGIPFETTEREVARNIFVASTSSYRHLSTVSRL